jgi:phosphoribosylglycinamide formyltransferase 2
LFCPPIGHRQERGDYQESWQPQPVQSEHLQEAQEMAAKVTKALGGEGIWGVEFFITKDGPYFSELSPRPHDTGLVTLAGTQNFSEFELHARAIIGLPIPQINLLRNGASSVILATHESAEFPKIDGVEAASNIPNTNFSIFGKPSSRPYRRMGVALAYGNEDVQELVSLAKQVSSKITVS